MCHYDILETQKAHYTENDHLCDIVEQASKLDNIPAFRSDAQAHHHQTIFFNSFAE